jgi:hypothetical protein
MKWASAQLFCVDLIGTEPSVKGLRTLWVQSELLQPFPLLRLNQSLNLWQGLGDRKVQWDRNGDDIRSFQNPGDFFNSSSTKKVAVILPPYIKIQPSGITPRLIEVTSLGEIFLQSRSIKGEFVELEP